MKQKIKLSLKPGSQNHVIINWLLSGGSVTRFEAAKYLKAGMCLSSRIAELRNLHGFPIKSTPERHGKAIVHRYSLPV